MAMNFKRAAIKLLAYLTIMSFCFQAGLMIKSTWAEIMGAIVGVCVAMFMAEISLLGVTISLTLISVIFPMYIIYSMNSGLGIQVDLAQIVDRVPVYVLFGPLVSGIITFLVGRHLTLIRPPVVKG